MGTYIVRKVMTLIPMLLIISFLIFGGIELMPGDAADFLISPEAMANMEPAALEALRDSMGLNDPFLMRYWDWLMGLLRGDFGYSLQSGVPVSQLMLNYLPATLELSIASLIVSTILGSIFGVISAMKKGTLADNILSVAGMIGVAIPQFLFGLLCIVVFSFNLGWLPVGGRMAYMGQSFFERLPYLIMPSLVLGFSMMAGVMRYSRSSMLDSLNRDYIKTARSKGLPEWRINLVHGLRVAMSPVIVLVGFRLPMLIGGAVVIEQ
ncbi:MAG: ABC transporter permease, partial [Angelakisella sp.]